MIYFITFLLLCSVTYADVYVLYDKSSKDLYSLSEQDDAVQPKEKEKIVIKGKKIEDLGIIYPHSYYKYDGGRLKIKTDMLEKDAKEEVAYKAKEEEEKRINDEIRKMAIERIKARNESLPITEGGK